MKKLCMILPLALILCFTVGCQDKEAMAELEEFRAQAEVEEQNKELVRHLFEEVNKGNPEIVKELCSPDYVHFYPSNTPKPRSREEGLEKLKMGFTVFPDINFSIKELFADGNTVIVWYIYTGTHECIFRTKFPPIPG